MPPCTCTAGSASTSTIRSTATTCGRARSSSRSARRRPAWRRSETGWPRPDSAGRPAATRGYPRLVRFLCSRAAQPLLAASLVGAALLLAAGAAADDGEPPAPVVRALRFEGAKAASRASLEALLATPVPPRWWQPFAEHPVFVPGTEQPDAERIERHYQTLGHFETDVRP